MSVFLNSPAEFEREEVEVSALVAEAVRAAPIDTRRDLPANIVVSSRRMHDWVGFDGHLSKNIEAVFSNTPSRCAVRCRVTHTNGLYAWCGGSILGSLSYFKDMPFKFGMHTWQAESSPDGVVADL